LSNNTFKLLWMSSHKHTYTQPFYSSLNFVRDNPGWAGTRRYISPSSGFSGAKWR